MDLKALLGRRIRELRKFRGWNQRTLAERADMAEEAIGDIERGGSWPRPESLLKIAEALQVNVSDLFKHIIDDDAEPTERDRALSELRDILSGLSNRHLSTIRLLADDLLKHQNEDDKGKDSTKS